VQISKSVLALVATVLILSMGCAIAASAQDMRQVQASEIVGLIKNNKPVEYDHIIVVGDLDLSKLNITSPLSITDSRFDGIVSLNDTTLGDDLVLLRCNFQRHAYFVRSTFSGLVKFAGCTFGGIADFWKSTFNGNADFTRSTFSGEVMLGESTFGRNADFSGCIFINGAGFPEARFHGIADFSDARFDDIAYFYNAKFMFNNGYAEFADATFNNKATFSRATFVGDADFLRANFMDLALFNDVNFKNASFTRAAFLKDASFSMTRFDGWALFFNSEFNGDVSFYQSRFSGLTSFNRSKFGQYADFTKCSFQSDAEFGDCKFKDTALFEEAHFLGTLNLYRSDYDNLYIRWNDIKRLAFNDTVYLRLTENFKKLGLYSDADQCYVSYRNQNRQNLPLYYQPIDFLLWILYGYGTMPELPIIWSLLVILLCGGFFYFTADIETPDKKTTLMEAMYLSAAAFTSGARTLGGFVSTPEDVKVKGRARYVLAVEKLLGLLLVGLFLTALARTVIR